MMSWVTRIVAGVVACSACAPTAPARELPAKPRTKVEFRWMEEKPVKGLTEDKGTAVSCGPVLWYLHKQPILTSRDVAGATLWETDLRDRNLTGSYHTNPKYHNLGLHYTVELRLTGDAKKKLVAACVERERGLLAVLIDGEYMGVGNFQKAKADEFVSWAGAFESKAEAERLVATFK
jgi:hypothetical protein